MYICIEGNIGAGKTTLAIALAKQLNANYLPEQFEENTLLPLFYQNKKKFAFPTEYSFLIDRQKQLTTYFRSKKNQSTVSDYHFDKCLCFAKVNLSKHDFTFFTKHYTAINDTLLQPNLIVYLNVEVDLVTKNIKKRGREMEQQIETTYLKKLKKTLDAYYQKKDNTLIITITNYNSSTIYQCCKTILSHLKTIANA